MSAATPATDEPSLLQRIADGDRSAVQECVDSYGSLVWSLARRLTPNRQDAEEAVQEIFLALWRHAGRFDPAAGSETLFVTTVARRRLIDRLRLRQQRAPRLDALPGDLKQLASRTAVDESTAAGICIDAGLAARALAQLDQEPQTMLKLSILLGLSYDEIARATDTPPAAIKMHIRRGLLQVRQAMAAAYAAAQPRAAGA